jgi:hypothetical protein
MIGHEAQAIAPRLAAVANEVDLDQQLHHAEASGEEAIVDNLGVRAVR